VSWAPSKVNEVDADNAAYYFISLKKIFWGCEWPLFPQNFFWVRTPPVFCLRSIGLQTKSIKSMLITQHTISSVSENVYEAVNNQSSPKTFYGCEHPQFFCLKFSWSPSNTISSV
jgi:hypothetical protein